jgi:putative FmdB family regulatory protein
MPIYEYACRACAHGFEALVFGSDRPECPACGTKDIEKRFSAFAVGGSGFARSASSVADTGSGSCGSCGDPRGPGACRA